MIFWFFGLPGVGKDYCANVFSKKTDIPYINADDFLTPQDQEALTTGNFTVEHRLKKLSRIVSHIKKVLNTFSDVAVSDSLPDNKSRNYLMKEFKEDITFILVKAEPEVHQKRLKSRKNHFFTVRLLDNWVAKHWQEIKIPHIILENNIDNDPEMGERIERLINLNLTERKP